MVISTVFFSSRVFRSSNKHRRDLRQRHAEAGALRGAGEGAVEELKGAHSPIGTAHGGGVEEEGAERGSRKEALRSWGEFFF
jgi:hypothetical protein